MKKRTPQPSRPMLSPARSARPLSGWAALEPLEPRVLLAVFTVTTADDDGAGSLRDAIVQANAAAGADTIEFNIAGEGVHTIALASPLPEITDAVTINGYTQPGASPNTLATGSDAVLRIELDGSNAGGGANGLVIAAGGSTVRGLIINRFASDGIELNDAGGNVIAGNFIGTDASGTADLGNGDAGVSIESDSHGNTIGGSNIADRNVILGNGTHGVEISSSNNVVAVNVITGNSGAGVVVLAGSGNSVRSSIAVNGGLGIDLGGDGVTANDAGDADSGANDLQNFPVITSAVTGDTTTVAGTLNALPSTTFTLHFYSSDAADGSGFGEGQRLLGSTTVATDGAGDAAFAFQPSVVVAVGRFVTATATGPTGSTSEFSAAVEVQADEPEPEPTKDLTATFDPAPVTVAPGASTSVTVTVGNAGDADVTEDFVVRVYASADGTLDTGSDALLGSATVTQTVAAGGSRDVSVTLNVPADFAEGDYTLFAVVDATGAVGESDETNNEAASGAGVLTVEAAPPPATRDLTASLDPAPFEVERGGSRQVTVTVGNLGNADVTADFVVRVYASGDGVFSAGSDTLLGSATVTQTVAAGGTRDVTVTLSVPSDLATGTYTLFAVADAAGDVDETDETNNVGSSDAGVMTVTAPPPATRDLTATFDPSPVELLPGGATSVTVGVSNLGDASVTDDFVVRVYASSDGSFDAGEDPLLGSANVTQTVAASARVDVDVSITVPGNLRAGAYRLIAVVDATDAVDESSESNNVAASDAGALTVLLAPQPDLTVSFDPAPVTLNPGQSTSVSVSVGNGGDAAVTEDFLVRVYASTDGSLDEDGDTLLGSAVVTQDVAAGADRNVEVTLTVPAGLASGDYRLIAAVDATGAIAESNEGNNRDVTDAAVLTVIPPPAPDLVAAFDPLARSVRQGRTTGVSVLVRNLGNAAAPGGFVVRVFASTDGTLGGGDTELGSATVPDAIAAGGQSEVDVTLSVPADFATGTYTLIAVVDATEVVSESDEGNNETASDADVLTVTPALNGEGTPFGRGSDGPNKVSFLDIDGTRVTFRLRGPGSAMVFGSDGDSTFSVELTGTDPKQSSLIITTNDGGDGEADIDGITVNGSMKAILARTSDLHGDINVTGTLARLVMDDLGGLQHTITIAGNGADDRSKVNIVFDDVSDLTINSAIGIKALEATRWLEGEDNSADDAVTAPWLQRLLIATDFEADLNLSGVDAPNTRALKQARIGGALRNAAWTLAAGSVGNAVALGAVEDFALTVDAGDVRKLRLGAVTDATVLAPAGDILSIVATQWLDGQLRAEWVKAVKITGDTAAGVRGDFGADIATTDSNARLNKLLVRGLVDGVSVRTAGNLGRVEVGAIRGSDVFAGVDGDAPAAMLPGSAQIGQKAISSFTTTGNVDEFTNDLGLFLFIDSNVAASMVHAIRLRNVDLEGGDDAFGFEAARVEDYRRNTVRFGARDLNIPADYDSAIGNYRLRIIA